MGATKIPADAAEGTIRKAYALFDRRKLGSWL
jgi:nucleoside diphosphate kinase